MYGDQVMMSYYRETQYVKKKNKKTERLLT